MLRGSEGEPADGGPLPLIALDWVNKLDQEEFVARFGSLFEHSPWVAEEAWRSRPFGSVEEMWRAFEDAMYAAPLDRLSPGEFEAFTRMNREYREKFDLPMVVCVREHTKESIIENVQSRLGNSRGEEIRRALAEISKISHHRLLDLVEREGKRRPKQGDL
jgi:2-oxo-4-hydroxy-4-carboxy--5-ureidoimidazoline (OHCU) decarboxylase